MTDLVPDLRLFWIMETLTGGRKPLDMAEYAPETADEPAEIQSIAEQIRTRIQLELPAGHDALLFRVWSFIASANTRTQKQG